MRPNSSQSPSTSRPLTLVIQCPVCTQSLLFRGPAEHQPMTCPVCEAPLRVRVPQLGEQEILDILGRPPIRP